MKKSYRLLKDLPDVKAGAIFEKGEVLDTYFLVKDKTGLRYNSYCYGAEFVEANSTWFSEIVERDWEIVKIGKNAGNTSMWKKDIKEFMDGCPRWDEWKIIEVKRLSDGEVFSVGDTIEFLLEGRIANRTIKEFKVDDKTITVIHNSGLVSNRPELGIFHLIKKLPAPQPMQDTESSRPFAGETVTVTLTKENFNSDGEVIGLKLYTEKQLNEEREKAFNAGRERIGGFWNEMIKNWTYSSFRDYKSPAFSDYKNTKK